jgi:hypothetical protein
MDIQEFTKSFLDYAKKNGVTAEPTVGPHEGTTRMAGNVEQLYATFTRDENTFEIPLNLLHTSGGGQVDSYMREVRDFYSLKGPLPLQWDKHTGAQKQFEPRAKGGPVPDPKPISSPVGPPIPGTTDRFQHMGGPEVKFGTIHTAEDGKRYKYKQDGKFSVHWQLVE